MRNPPRHGRRRAASRCRHRRAALVREPRSPAIARDWSSSCCGRRPAAFLAWCRANPKLATYGSPGVGTRPHLLGVMLARAAGVELAHLPYKGGVEAMQDLLAGQLPALITTATTAMPHLKAGRLRALATTARARGLALPQVPTFDEAGYPALQGTEWFGTLAPAGTSAETVDALAAAIRAALESGQMTAGLEKMAAEIAPTTPAAFAKLIRSDLDRWAAVVKDTAFQPLD